MDKGSRRPTQRTRNLRINMTAPERKLWAHLRNRQIAGVRFNSQFPIGEHYIGDFVSRGSKLVIEVDGETHVRSREEDAARTRYLNSQGYRVIRFWNNDVMRNIEGVVAEIERVLNEIRNSPSPNPSRKREGDGSVDTSDPSYPLSLRERPGEGMPESPCP